LVKFSEMGINVIDTKEARLWKEIAAGDPEPDGEGTESVETQRHKARAKSRTKASSERTDDPCAPVPPRDGLGGTALPRGRDRHRRRIEAGREAMIAGLCESPVTFQAIVVWRDELNHGEALLRDIIDHDAMYAGSDPSVLPTPEIDPNGQTIASIAVACHPEPSPQMRTPDTTSETTIKPASEATDGNEMAARGMIGERNLDDDEDDKESWFSIAAVEAELRPKVVVFRQHRWQL
jgi:RNA polymerase primary sigma factor